MRAAPSLIIILLLVAPLLAMPAGATPIVADDAGSGRDAPDTAAAAQIDPIWIDPGVVYSGALAGTLGDSGDLYFLHLAAGDSLNARLAMPGGCIALYDSAGTFVTGASACELGGVNLLGSFTHVAPATGDYLLRVAHVTITAGNLLTSQGLPGDQVPTVPLSASTQAYRFSYAVNAAAPNPSLADASIFAALSPLPPVSPSSESGPHTVVAVVDTGGNPYHRFFRAPALVDAPSTWLPGYPASATAVPLTFGAADVPSALAADAATWGSLQRSSYNSATDSFTTHLYTFPGTRVVGAVSFGEYNDLTGCGCQGTIPVYDEIGHGTHSLGLAAGAGLPQADGNVLVVIVEVDAANWGTGVRWAARQPWIDAISLSAGVLADAPVTTSPTGDKTGTEWATLEAAQHHKAMLIASGNGFSDTGLTPDHCVTYTSEFTGPAWVTRVGAAEPASGDPTWWHCVPVDIIARTDVASPDNSTFETSSDASGTSAATPNMAGHLAALTQWIRARGDTISAESALPYLTHAAQPAPIQPGFGRDISASPASAADQGYGLVDGAALQRAKQDYAFGGAPADRQELAAWFAADHALRVQLWGPGSATDDHVDPLLAGLNTSAVDDAINFVLSQAPPIDNPVPGNDAGSGRDAGSDEASAIPISPGVVYDGAGQGATDTFDDYTFVASAGQTLKFSFSGPGACVNLYAPSGARTLAGCDFGAIGVGGESGRALDESGTWRFEVENDFADAYEFAITLDGSAPPAADAANSLPGALLP